MFSPVPLRSQRLLAPLLVPFLFACHSLAQGSAVIAVGEGERSYIEHVPADLDPDRPAPLLLVFHGGGGSAQKALDGMGFDRLVDEVGVAIAYPDGIEGHWNDGRGGEKFAEQDAKVDDVAYVLEILSDMQHRHPIDPARVYAVGASNGGMFVQRLAIEHPESFAAVASIISSIPEPLAEDFAPAAPLPVLFMNGTEDPIMPYAGGEVTLELFPRLAKLTKPKSRGRVVAVERAASMWAKRNGLDPKPTRRLLANPKKLDGCRVELQSWSKDGADPEVLLYRVIGGGHTLPGRSSYLPKRIVGRTCGDIDAVDVIWDFLSAKRRASVDEEAAH